MMFVKIRDEDDRQFGDFHINISSLKERIDHGDRFVLKLTYTESGEKEYTLFPEL
jgi:copper(I)-binding protein